MVTGIQHLTTLVFVAWRHDHHIRDAAQEGEIKRALVRLAVSPHNARAIDSKQHRQLLNGNVMDNLIVGALQEGRVDRYHRLVAANRQARSKGYRVLLGDSHVEILVRVFFGKLHHAGAFTHGRRHRHQHVVFRRRFAQPVAKDF